MRRLVSWLAACACGLLSMGGCGSETDPQTSSTTSSAGGVAGSGSGGAGGSMPGAGGGDDCAPSDNVVVTLYPALAGMREFEADCSVITVSFGNPNSVSLDCGRIAPTLQMGGDPPIDLNVTPGQLVHFTWRGYNIEGPEEWVSLRSTPDGELLVGWVSASRLEFDRTDAWYAPLTITEAGCGGSERRSLDVSFGGDTVTVVDGQRATVGPAGEYVVQVQSALVFANPIMQPGQYRIAIARQP